MSNAQFAALVYLLIATGAAFISGIAGFTYVRTDGRAGGFICLFFLFWTYVAASQAADIVNHLK